MAGDTARASDTPLAVFVCLKTLQNRPDFLRASRARRHATPGFVLQALDRQDDDPSTRIGYTCSKKVGNAVARNRAKRRLRAIAAEVLPKAARPGWDYVLIGRAGSTADLPYATLCDDLIRALSKLHK